MLNTLIIKLPLISKGTGKCGSRFHFQGDWCSWLKRCIQNRRVPGSNPFVRLAELKDQRRYEAPDGLRVELVT